MENDSQTTTSRTEEVHENTEEVDPIIADEAEQFLQQALEVSNRFGLSLHLTPEKDLKEEIEKQPKKVENGNQETYSWETSSFQKEAKLELQARLRKRIEQKEALATQQAKGTSHGGTQDSIKEKTSKTPKHSTLQTACEEHKKKHEKCPPECPNKPKEATFFHEPTAVTKLGERGGKDSEAGSNKTQGIEVIGALPSSNLKSMEIDSEDTVKEEEDNVEGFLIFCDDSPKDPSKLGDPDFTTERVTASKRRKSNGHTSESSTKKPSKPQGQPGTPIFGPQVVKRALVTLGGRASAVAIAEWIAINRPQYLNYFGSQKKLRYSVSGILSARTYAGIFQKKLIIQKGIRKADWLLIDNAELPEEVPWDGSVVPAAPSPTPAVSTKQEEEKISEESLSGLLSLSEAVGEVRQQDSQIEAADNPYEVKTCQVCNLGTNDDQLLLCDNCDLGYHMFCLEPPLAEVPKGAWFCEYCIPFLEHKVNQESRETPLDIELKEGETETLDGAEDLVEGEIVSPRACEKHRRWKKRCPDNCPMRAKLKAGSKKLKGWGKQKDIKFWRAKRKPKVEVPEQKVVKKPKLNREPINENVPTYIDMIEEAINALGGKGTTPDITNYMEEHHGELLATKTKTWRNSVSGCLSTHFVRAGKDKMGRTVWNLQKLEDKSINNNTIISPSPPSSTMFSKPQTRQVKEKEIKLKVPSRFSQRIYDPAHLEELRKTAETLEIKEIRGIEYINRSNPLEVLSTKLTHPGAIMKMCWSNDGTMVATASTIGSIRIWDTSNWTQLQEIRDKEETNLEEFYCVLFSKDDKKIFAAGRIKDRNRFNEIENDNESLPGVIKIFDIVSGNLLDRLEGHKKDVLFMKMVVFGGQNYLLSTGHDGIIIKWKMNQSFSSCISQTKIADQATQMALHLDFVPDTGNKFFIACCDNGLKLFDFETEQLIQSFPGLFGYLCDCVEFVYCKELKKEANEHYLLVKGVEMMDENDELLQPNVCQLRMLTVPDKGQGKFRLEEVNTFGHVDYHSNTWMLKLASNGRYVLSPTIEGKVFVWNLRSGELVAILNDHANREVRDILFHPIRKILLTCGDDSMVRIYEQTKTSEQPLSSNVAQPIHSSFASPAPPSATTITGAETFLTSSLQKVKMDKKFEAEDAYDFTDEEDRETEVEDEEDEGRKRRRSEGMQQRKEEEEEEEEGEDEEEDEDINHKDPTKKLSLEKRRHSAPPSFPKPKKLKKERKEILDEYDLMYKRRGRGLPGACEKHKREHMKCSADCPNRKIKIPNVPIPPSSPSSLSTSSLPPTSTSLTSSISQDKD